MVAEISVGRDETIFLSFYIVLSLLTCLQKPPTGDISLGRAIKPIVWAWASYEQEKVEKDNATKAKKEEKEQRNEMEQSVRMFDIRTSGGRQSFLNLVIQEKNRS